MFAVKQARSRRNKVEYVEIDLDKVFEFLLNEQATIIQSDKKFDKHSHEFPLSDHSTLTLSKIMTKGKKILKEIIIKLDHGTWCSGIRYDATLTHLGGYNYNSFDVSYGWEKTNKKLLYLVMDGGFAKNTRNRYPYFLSDYQFNYVYEKVKS
jgi:hypothetical protein